MMLLGFKNLWQEKTRLAVSVGGLAVAIFLVFALDGIFAGTERQVTAFITDSPRADVWVAQSGVSNLHMATSRIPEALGHEIRTVKGVKSADSIHYFGTYMRMGGARQLSYVVGFDPGGVSGGPWLLRSGTARLERGEIVVDEVAARKRGLGLGDSVTLLGRNFRIVGLSGDTYSIANTYTFVRRDELGELIKANGQSSYYIVDAEGNPEAVARAIEADVPGTAAFSRDEFVASERRLIGQMGIELINTLAVIGFLIGALVVGLTVYTLTLERTREFGIIKAVGASPWRLYRTVFEQSILCVILGMAAGVALAYLASFGIEYLLPEIEIAYRPELFLRAALALGVIGFLASYVPIRRVAKLDPMVVFQA